MNSPTRTESKMFPSCARVSVLPSRRVLGALLASVMAVVSPTRSPAASGLEDPVITVNQFRAALQDGDIATVLELLAPDVLIYEAGQEETSRDIYAAQHLKADIAHLAKVYVDTLSQSSRADETLAWVTTRSRFVSREPDSRPPAVGTETIALRRSARGWQIVHVHWSSTATGAAP